MEDLHAQKRPRIQVEQRSPQGEPPRKVSLCESAKRASTLTQIWSKTNILQEEEDNILQEVEDNILQEVEDDNDDDYLDLNRQELENLTQQFQFSQEALELGDDDDDSSLNHQELEKLTQQFHRSQAGLEHGDDDDDDDDACVGKAGGTGENIIISRRLKKENPFKDTEDIGT
jgi:hypothetical protein